mmetsp:Transcript_12199/g.29730  ORF Transcript_12199/g.29730 Transcript_12199/m.29730 type:complete len:202 (-) Transcript_12199:108-713(-)
MSMLARLARAPAGARGARNAPASPPFPAASEPLAVETGSSLLKGLAAAAAAAEVLTEAREVAEPICPEEEEWWLKELFPTPSDVFLAAWLHGLDTPFACCFAIMRLMTAWYELSFDSSSSSMSRGSYNISSSLGSSMTSPFHARGSPSAAAPERLAACDMMLYLPSRAPRASARTSSALLRRALWFTSPSFLGSGRFPGTR